MNIINFMVRIRIDNTDFKMILFDPKMEGCFWNCIEGLQVEATGANKLQIPVCRASGNHRHDNGIRLSVLMITTFLFPKSLKVTLFIS